MADRCTCRKGARCAYCMERDRLTTAEYAFEDSLIAHSELGHEDVAERLRDRWPEVGTR